ncbi:DNA-binding transcriptional response regulator, NtrC family, contains REC, AAA-type ATPase, and a Fis-type DNA-binding domains [Izhakiella capsodis]|uniref:DNA-binding transcriptional response regulator, NtrC family, contains REC, AAA-type ATPase, and a Fis-type DNA-binding domains n=1 Tax=Izhakiella capsodis TaxID=1367852 RepID=A0A1I4YBR4_9GAMM|nr:sigma-54 dependent transcriptional regulator [Izhakiella capsodis]SFN35521.1 DNA-binding transcriptional response regulator, NtrC family, contains REC, AAA-type ATPase, and a Fis-type DNA-binding domains [Izhakiella capsodis]
MGVVKYSHRKDGLDYIAVDPSSVEAFSLAGRVAKFNVPVLITGETGTGKECIAKYIHGHSADENAAYVGINCAAIPENMLEAMLFGYEKGAFTGAINSQPGKLELANGGTLLLDEIGDMPIALQAKLLRVLQEHEVERLGSHKKIPLDLRLIASTNKDLEQEIAAGRFRQDLYYRLSVIPIHIKPLRHRVQDIMPLVQLFLRKYHALTERTPKLMPGARMALENYPWPGNVRELENVVQRGLILCGNGNLTATCFGLSESGAQSALIQQPGNENDKEADRGIRPIKRQGRMAESQYILDLLQRNQGNKSKTAESLGITPRALRYRLASMREQGFDTGFF